MLVNARTRCSASRPTWSRSKWPPKTGTVFGRERGCINFVSFDHSLSSILLPERDSKFVCTVRQQRDIAEALSNVISSVLGIWRHFETYLRQLFCRLSHHTLISEGLVPCLKKKLGPSKLVQTSKNNAVIALHSFNALTLLVRPLHNVQTPLICDTSILVSERSVVFLECSCVALSLLVFDEKRRTFTNLEGLYNFHG